MEKYCFRSYNTVREFFREGETINIEKEINELANKLDKFNKNQFGGLFPSEFNELLLRDIFHYSTEELDNMSMIDYNKALVYAQRAYTHRDIYFIVTTITNALLGKNEYSIPNAIQDKNLDFHIDQKEITDWIEKQNKELKEKGVWLGPK